MRGGWRGRRAQVVCSVACSGSPQIAHPPSPRNSICRQHPGRSCGLRRRSSRTGAARRKREIERPAGAGSDAARDHRRLSLAAAPSHKRRDGRPVRHGAARASPRSRRADGPELFLYERAFADCLERIALIPRRFGSAADRLPRPGWPARLGQSADGCRCRAIRAAVRRSRRRRRHRRRRVAAGSRHVMTSSSRSARSTRVNDLPLALRLIRPCDAAADGLFIGAMSGGDTLPQLRARDARRRRGRGRRGPHVHPRIEASALAPLLGDAGFVEAGGRRRPRAGLLSLARPARRATCARWARPTSSRNGRAAALSTGRASRGRRGFRSRGHDGRTSKRSKSSISPPGLRPKQTDSGVNSIRGRVVNPRPRKPAAWTWTRGGWRDRYPKEFAQASRRPARSDCDRIRLDRRADRHRDDRRLAALAAASAACGARSATRCGPTC